MLLLLAAAASLLDVSHRGDVAAARQLLASGAAVNEANDLGATPLWAACESGNLLIARLLLEAGADPNRALLQGESPLMAAARGGFTGVAAALLAKGASPDARGPRGQTALMWAASRKHPETVRALIEGKADVHLRSAVWSEVAAVPPHGHLPYNRAIPHGGDTALLFAARAGDVASVQVLLSFGANANDADAWGVTALNYATHGDFRDVAEFLLARGANPDLAEPGFAPLHNAVMHRNEKLVAALLARGANPNARLTAWTPTRRSSRDYHYPPALVGASPLWLAARFRHPGIARLLLKQRADARFVHRLTYLRDGEEKERNAATSLIAAALGDGGGMAWSDAAPGDQLAVLRVLVEEGGVVPTREEADEARRRKLGEVAEYLSAKLAR